MEKIAIFGVPRSGTTWLSQIFSSHPDVVLRFQPLFSYAHKGRLSVQSSAEEIYDFFNEIFDSTDDFVLMNTDLQKSYPKFLKSASPTHIALKETRYLHIIENILKKCPEINIIGIVRNPLAVLASWILAPKEYNQTWDVLREWRSATGKNQNKPEEFYGFDKWKEAVTNFLRFELMYPDQFKMIRYNQLNARPLEIVTDLFKFCDLNIHSQVREFIASSRSVHDSDPYSVFRGKANDDNWQNVLPDEVVQQIVLELKHTPLENFLKVGTNA